MAKTRAPANDIATSIHTLLLETAMYGIVIISIVVTLLILCISIFCIDYPIDKERYGDQLFNEPRLWRDNDRHGRDRGFPVYFTRNEESFLDICFLVLPTIIIILILIPTLGFLYSNELLYDNTVTAFSIDVIGHQWYWSYEYHFNGNADVCDFTFDSILDIDAVENVNLEVDKRVIIPTDVRISITITSTDVIHSWAVPQLGIKIDAIPGRLANSILHAFISGVYYGQCSELCGVLHGFMPICVEAVPVDLFFHWAVLNIELTEYISCYID